MLSTVYAAQSHVLEGTTSHDEHVRFANTSFSVRLCLKRAKSIITSQLIFGARIFAHSTPAAPARSAYQIEVQKIQTNLTDFRRRLLYHDRAFADVVQQVGKIGVREVGNIIADLGSATGGDCVNKEICNGSF